MTKKENSLPGSNYTFFSLSFVVAIAIPLRTSIEFAPSQQFSRNHHLNWRKERKEVGKYTEGLRVRK